MTYIVGKGKQHKNASLDRIDPTGGYKIGNIQLVCHAANMMKQDFGMNELREWCNKILGVKNSIHQ
jgi:hypothetical protein